MLKIFVMYPAANLYLTPDLNIAEVVLDNPRIILLLEHFNIYVPLHEKTIREISIENNLNFDLFLTFANLYNGISYTSPVQFSFDEVQSIINFLKKSHTYYTEEMYPDIRNNIKQMFEVNNYEEMALIDKFFKEYFKEVTVHLNYEDNVAFPYMKNLHEHLVKGAPITEPVTYSVKEYKEHHDDIEEKLNDLKNILVKYLPPKNDQKLRRRLFFNLSELENDLNIHAIIEDMILIPLVEQMEQYLKNLSE